MAAICALYRFDEQPVESESIAAMLRAMGTWGRGPEAVWTDSTCRSGLGARLMRVTPEDAFDVQPRTSSNGECTIVADARIDNRPELFTALGIDAAEAAAMPDSALVLAAWKAWGPDCVRRLIGDFAFIVHDRRDDSLFCARDPLGQRVLYVHEGRGRIALASAIPALFALPDVERRLDEQKIAELLMLLENGATTCFAGVTRLRPGHTLTASRGGTVQRRYWIPDPGRPIRLGSDEDYLEAFREVFGRAVRDRLRSARPVGITLSAGLDSSAVAASAAEALHEAGGRLAAFHSAPREEFAGTARPGWVNDESADVRALAAMHDNIDLTILRGHDATPLADAEKSFEIVWAPVRNSINLSWMRRIYETAEAAGIGVMLNGGKGNLTISHTGLRTIAEQARRGQLVGAISEARAVARARGHRPRDVIRDQVLRPLIPPALLSLYGRFRNGQEPPVGASALSAIRPDFARATNVEEIVREQLDEDARVARVPGPEYRYRKLAAGGDGFDVFHSFRGWFPIETREAPTDLRVVEFCLGIPESQYMRGGRDRRLIRDGMRNRIPPSILERTTRGAQAADWPAWFGAMRPEIESELRALQDVDLARRCLDLDRMTKLVEQWPARFGPEHMPDYTLLLLRGLMMGRFIRWFEENWA